MARNTKRADTRVTPRDAVPDHKSAVAKLIYRALEARMVFDAAMGETVAEAASGSDSGISDSSSDDVIAALSAATECEVLAAAPLQPTVITIPTSANTAELTVVACLFTAPQDATDGREVDQPSSVPLSAATSIVFIDPRVANSDVIAAHIAADAEIVMLDMERGGLEQIAAHLAGRTDIASLHLLSHGANGQIELGGSLITREALDASQDVLATIGRAVQNGGDILIYGCDVASDTAGRDFIDTLARMTGDDVAASTDATGAQQLGGDWLLEYTTGAVETSAIDATSYQDILLLVASDDTNTISASATAPVTGNVLTNDTGTSPRTIMQVHGRATSVGVAYQTAYGTITMNANGSYSYAVDTNNATVLGLTSGQSITDIVAYSGRDNASATLDHGYLTITINGVSNAPIADNNFASVTPVSSPDASGNLITDATGGAQPDTIDRPQSLFRWETEYASGANVSGTSRTVDGVIVSVSTTAINPGTFTAVVSTATQGGHSGYLAETIDPSALSYTAPTTTFEFSEPVVNLSFGLLDVDYSGGATWQDQVTIVATRDEVPVTFQAQFAGWVTRTGDSFFGNTGGVNNTDANGNIVVVFDGPVDSVVITLNDGPSTTRANPDPHLIGISDLTWQNNNGSSIIMIGGVAVPAGGVTIPATYGTITVQQNGSYTYNVDQTNPAVIALPVGATLIDTVPYILQDSLGQTDGADLLVTINGRNEVPVLDLNGATAGSGHEATYTENGTGVGIANTGVIADVDTGSTIASASVVLTNRQPGDALSVSGLPAGVTALIDTSNLAQITVTLTGVDSRANYATYLSNIHFSSSSDSPSTVDRTINVTVNDGLADSGIATSIIHVIPVNDAPAGADATRAINEDASYTFAASDFGFADPLDSPANTLQSVIITTLPPATDGVLRLSGVAVTTGQELTVAEIAQLIFSPASSVNGNGLGAFTFQVRDNGGTANGGVNLDPTPNTFRFDVAPINDSPVAVGDSGSTLEDQAVTLTAATLLANDADVDSGDTRTLVSVQDAVNGTVSLDGSGNPVFMPNANFVGTGSFTYTMRDAAGATSIATVTITIDPVNDIPSGADATRTINEDTPYTFSATDFPLADSNDTPTNLLQAVVITTLPSATDGVLRLNGVAVTAGQVIAATDIGNLTYMPAGDRNGTGLGAFTFQVRDSGGTANGGVDTDGTPNTFRFDVTANADIANDLISTLEDMPVTFNVLAGTGGATTDSFEGAPQVTSITQPTGGTVVFAADGTMTFTPNANFNGAASFTYTVTSGGVTETATVTIGVSVVNDAPASSVPGPQSVNEDAILNFSGTITISDVDAGATGIETVTLAVAHGTLTLSATGDIAGLTGNGTATVSFSGTVAQINTALASLGYRGDANYYGPDQLQVQVLDDGRDNGTPASNGALPASIRVVPITVVPVNDPPVAANDTVAATEDTPITIPSATLLANDGDLDGDTLTITAVGGATNGTVTLVGGNPVFTPVPNYFGPASFTYTISDGQGGTSTATVNLVIAPVNDAPTALNDVYTTTEDTILTVGAPTRLTANDSDVDGGVLNVVQVNGNAISSGAPITLPSGAVLTQNADGTFSYNPNGAFDQLAMGVTTTDVFTYQVSDGLGGLATATATITITGVNDAPAAVADTNSTNPRVAITISAADGVLDNDTDTDTAHTALTVTDVTNGAATVAAGAAITGTNGGIFTINADGSYNFDPGTDFDSLPFGSSATTSVTYAVSDGQGGTATATLTIAVPYQNLPPFLVQAMPPQTSTDGTAIALTTAQMFSDPNPIHQGNLTISAAGLPPGLAIDAAGNITGTLTADASQHAGPYIITLTATDPLGSEISTTFQFTVSNVGPTAVNDINSVSEHSTTTGNVLSNDADGGLDSDALNVTQINGSSYTPGSTITLLSGAQIVMAADGTYSYDPHGAFDGMAVGTTATDAFTYQVSDGQGGFVTATATITINGQNDAPIIVDPNNPGIPPVDPNNIVPPQTGLDGTAITPITVRGYFNDPDNGDTLTLSVTGVVPPGVTFDPVTGTFTGTPVANASQGGPANNGVYTVLVNATDGNGGVVSTAISFTIGNPAPIANSDSNTVAEHSTTSGNIIDNDSDGNGDGDTLTVATVNGTTLVPGNAIALPSGALLVMQADGAYSYNPNGMFSSLQSNQTATDTFTYTISDGQGGTATATATLIIQGQNDSPVAAADTNATDPRVAITVAAGDGLLINDTDPEADPLTVSTISNGGTIVAAGAPISGTNGGTFTINADGSYTFDPGAAFDGLPPGTSASTSVTYTISDGQGGTSTTTLTISVPYANLPPAVQQPIASQLNADGAAVSIPVVNVFADPNPGDTLTITASGLPPGLSYNPISGAIEGTLTADASQNGGQPYTVTLLADDGLGGTVSSTFQFTVANPVPVASNDLNTVAEHGTASGAVIGNDTDGGLDADTLTVSQVNGMPFAVGSTTTLPSGAELVMNADGTYDYNPNGAFNGLAVGETRTDSFTYQVSDGQGGVATATVVITISGQNETPIIIDPANPGTPIDPNQVVPAQTGQDGTAIVPLTVTSYFGDADTTDTLTLAVNTADLPPGLAFNPATGTFSGIPTATASQGGNAGPGVYDVIVTADDGNGGTVSTTVRFNISNPAPVAADDANSVAEHGTTTGAILPNDTDGATDGDAVSVSQVNGAAVTNGATIVLPSGALLVMNTDGTYSYDPNGAFPYLQVGDAITDSFVYQISDGQGGFATARVTIVIGGQNDAPTANVDTNTALPQGSISVVAPLGVLSNDTDPESDLLSVTGITNGAATVTPGTAIAGTSGGTFTINADGSYTFAAGNDFDGLLFGTVATTSVTYTISDGQGGTSATTLTISVPYSDLPPVVNLPLPAQNSTDGSPVAISVSTVFRDPNPGDTLDISVTGLPPGLSFDPITTQITGTLDFAASQGGPYTVTLTATDDTGHFVSTTFDFTVTNPPPVALNDTNAVDEHDVIAGALATVNDRDGGNDSDDLAVTLVNGAAFVPNSIVTLPSGALLTMADDGTYAYDPNGMFDGMGLGETASDSFTYQISDGQGGTSTATVAITIRGENDAPVVIDPTNPGTPVTPGTQVVPTQTALDGSAIVPLNVTGFFADPDRNDTLTLSVPAASLPDGVTFDPLTGTFSGAPTADASQGGPASNGTYPVVVTATDANGLTTSTVVVFQIANPAPVAGDDVNGVSEDATVSGNVIAPNDRDGGADADTLAVTEVNGTPLVSGATITLPSGALLVMNADGSYDYDPNGVFNGLGLSQSATDTFTYQIGDGQGGFATATATIVIAGANDAPVVIDPATGLPPANPMAIIPAQTGSDGTPITPISVTPFFADPDASDSITLSVPVATLPPGVIFDPISGTFSGTPTADASTGGPGGNGVYPVVITATDDNGATVTTVITFTFGNVAPTADNDTNSVLEDATTSGTVIANDRDGGGDTDVLTVTDVNGVTLTPGATITLPSGAMLTVNADGTYVYEPNGAFEYLASGESGADTFSYQITDGQGGLATATVVITVVGQNNAPVTTSTMPPLTGRDGDPIQPLDVSAVFADTDASDTLTYAVAPGSLPPGLTFNPITGVFSGTPTSDASQGGPNGDGVFPVLVTASDGHGGTVTTLVTLTFSNPVPVATDDPLVRVTPDATVVLPVLGNDRDGGNDHDALVVTSASATSGHVTINPDGTLAFTPDAGFTGLVTITYVISDGQGGTATATTHVLVTIRPPVTAPNVILPTFQAAELPSNTGIDADTAVLSAVNGVTPLNAISGGLGASGAIDAAANQISSLGALSNGRGGLTYAVTDPRITNPVWRLQDSVSRTFGRGIETWQPEGLTGFSLRFTYATDNASSERKAELVLDSLVRDRTLIVNLSSTSVPSHARVTEYRVMQADGRPLPEWLDQAGGRVLIGERPADIEEIRLRVVAILSDGTSIERSVIVQTTTGEIKPLNEKRAAQSPTFGEQLQQQMGPKSDEFDSLMRALGR